MNKDPISFFLSKEKSPTRRSRPIDGLCNDIDGKVDDAWHESMKKRVPEILWNPNHPGRKTKTEKGGRGSGNWGHQGLADVWGGSSPTKTATKIPDKTKWSVSPKSPTPHLEDTKRSPHHKKISDVAERMKAFSGTDPDSGYSVVPTKISSATVQYKLARLEQVRLSYLADIQDENGMQIGELELNYYPDDNTGEIGFIYINANNRKTGFGRNYINHVENVFFENIGVDKIHLIAALDVGGYFWARAGYDFTKTTDKTNAIQWLEREWKYRYNTNVPKQILENLNHTWDIATLVGPDGFRVGKQTMLGVSWYGEKKPNGAGREIGKAYYGLSQ